MAWVWWLLAPLAVTLLVAVGTWLAGRPRRPPTPEQAVSSHRRFLDDLADATIPARLVRSPDSAAGTAPSASASPATQAVPRTPR